jgi:hypothetical protein
MYSLLDPAPCLDLTMTHMVERTLQGEIVQMKRERLIRITYCRVVESVMSLYCGWLSQAGVTPYLRFREPFTKSLLHAAMLTKTGMLEINKKAYQCRWVLSGLTLTSQKAVWTWVTIARSALILMEVWSLTDRLLRPSGKYQPAGMGPG